MPKRAIITFLILSCLILSTAQGEFYYRPDSTHVTVQVFDSLVAVGFDSYVEPEADMFAESRAYLIDNYEFKNISENITVFGIENGYSLEYVMAQLRAENDIYLVNPVMIGSDSTPIYATNQIVAYFNNDITSTQIDSLCDAFNLSIYRTIGTDSIYYFLEMEYSTDSTIFDICNAYFESGMVRFAMPNFIYQATPEGIPNDSYFSNQWHLHNTGQTGGTADADIDMPEAWDLKPPQYTKRLAIIDFGFEMDHDDNVNNYLMWPYDFVGQDILEPTPDSDPSPDCDTIFQNCYHGTSLLGLISAITDNSQGLAGIMDSIQIIPLKFADKNGETSPEVIIAALNYCNTSPHNADVLCCAWSINATDSQEIAINQRLQNLYNNGHPVFFAAGSKTGIYVKYPASSPWVWAVSATDDDDNIVYDYKPGYDSVDIRAPGKDLWSFDLSGVYGLNPVVDTCNGDDDYYCGYTGSSGATAIVAALAIKLLSTRDDIIAPFSPPDSLYSLLAHSANDLGTGGYDIDYGWGRVNAYRAMIAITRGDVNHDFVVNVADAVYLTNYVFSGGPEPTPYFYLGDSNCDGRVNVSDAVYIINYVFSSGEAPKICYLNLPD